MGKLDKRVFQGPLKEVIRLENERFNPNGTYFLGKAKVREIKENEEYGILYLYGKGL